MKSTGTILVAADRTANATQVQRVLAEEFERVEVSASVDKAVVDFDRVRPDVIVLAFESLEKSQQYCLGLLRYSKVAQSHPTAA